MTQLAAGNPAPLGASYDGKGVNFTLFSANADRVELCVFDGKGIEHRYDLVARTGDIWHGYLEHGPARHTLWLSRAWCVGSGKRAVL
ncbi:Glycogen debranching enzyme [Leclercia adecarboxylata]|uniref:Glycogen debranching enzyme n=1 Tax=Leclercia adecarboxylata TaxID=83655 RepID=A0A4U9IY09_9ENTR|nr:Glycogen debranching enzyme [Leclercia adecarboxylata]